MQLNIYKISHPIVQVIMDYIRYNMHRQQHEYYYRYIGLLLTYEMFRKYLKITDVYIKLINEVKHINLPNSKSKHIILTDISHTYDMITDIKIILPTVEIINVIYKNIEMIEESIKSLKIDNSRTQIFILEKRTSNKQLTNLITYLKHKKNLSIKNIILGSVQIEHEILNQIGNQYPELTVYTTNITSRIQ